MTEELGEAGLVLMSDAGVKQDTGEIGLGWLAMKAGRGELVAAGAVSAEVEGVVGDVSLEEMRAVLTALLFVAAVAQGQGWDEPVGGRQLAEVELAKVRKEVGNIRKRGAL